MEVSPDRRRASTSVAILRFFPDGDIRSKGTIVVVAGLLRSTSAAVGGLGGVRSGAQVLFSLAAAAAGSSTTSRFAGGGINPRTSAIPRVIW